jgi:hypothetical protein
VSRKQSTVSRPSVSRPGVSRPDAVQKLHSPWLKHAGDESPANEKNIPTPPGPPGIFFPAGGRFVVFSGAPVTAARPNCSRDRPSL